MHQRLLILFPVASQREQTIAHTTHIRTTVYGRGRGIRRPVGVRCCACDMTNIINHVHAHLAGLGVVGWVSVCYVECSDTIGPVGREESTVTA